MKQPNPPKRKLARKPGKYLVETGTAIKPLPILSGTFKDLQGKEYYVKPSGQIVKL